MHKTLKKRIFPILLIAALVTLLSVTGGCLKQSEVKWVEGEYTNPEDVVSIEEMKIPEPPPPPPPAPPAPKPVPVPVPEPTAKYTPKPVPKPEPTKIVLEEPGTRVDRRSYLIPTPEETAYQDFGLCAYIALPHMYPSQSSGIYTRYIKLHQAFKSVPQFEAMERKGPNEVNVLYWNLKRSAFSANAYNIFDLPDGFYVQKLRLFSRKSLPGQNSRLRQIQRPLYHGNPWANGRQDGAWNFREQRTAGGGPFAGS